MPQTDILTGPVTDNDTSPVRLLKLAVAAQAIAAGSALPPNVSNATGTLPIAHGGTGATTVQAALAAFGLDVLNLAPAISAAIPVGTNIYQTQAANAGTISSVITYTLPLGTTYHKGARVLIEDVGSTLTTGGSIAFAASGSNKLSTNEILSIIPSIVAPCGYMEWIWDGVDTWTPGAMSADIQAQLLVPNNSSFSEVIGILARAGTLSSGTLALTISGVSASSIATVSLAGGTTAVTTVHFRAVCTANTVTITALTAAGATVGTDASVVSIIIIK